MLRGRFEQQGDRAIKGAKIRVFQSINNYSKNNLSLVEALQFIKHFHTY